MKKLLLQYAAYNVWANQRMVECISNLSDDQINREITSSYKSINATLLHLWDAESIWWQRIKLQEQIDVPSTNFNGSVLELGNNLLKQLYDKQTDVGMKELITSFMSKNKREFNS